MDLFEWSQNIMKVDQNKVINDSIKNVNNEFGEVLKSKIIKDEDGDVVFLLNNGSVKCEVRRFFLYNKKIGDLFSPIFCIIFILLLLRLSILLPMLLLLRVNSYKRLFCFLVLRRLYLLLHKFFRL